MLESKVKFPEKELNDQHAQVLRGSPLVCTHIVNGRIVVRVVVRVLSDRERGAKDGDEKEQGELGRHS